ncbi:MAG: hypothetical protein IPK91_15825 [Saprospiraceae bacterium]|nr:hypothetical protein [Saprospiraceae bacterium]MBK8298712.1 hypothetical protein [Saprospiraceae bacterium]
MKLSPLKFSVALGLAFSISFILCNIFLVMLGKEITLQVLNSLFHEIDFKPLLIDNGFRFGKLLHGTLMLFVAGTLIGFITAFIYNLLTKIITTSSEDDSEKQRDKVITIHENVDDIQIRKQIGYKK